MFKAHRIILATICLFIAANPIHAADTTETDISTWRGSADIGYTASAGNSRTTTLVASAQTHRTNGNFTHHLEVRAKNTEQNHIRKTESYRFAAKEDLALTEHDYLFLRGAWNKDRFDGYDWQLALSTGYGRKLINEPRQHLSIEGGPGYRHDDLPAGNTEDTGLVRVAVNYDRQITDSTRFAQVLEADGGEDNTITRSMSELAVKINGNLAIKASVEFRRHSDPPVGVKNTDRTTLMSLAWTF